MTLTRRELLKIGGGGVLGAGILPFLKDGSEVPPELTEAYRGPAAQDYTSGDGD